jgi:CDP-diacylglycerol--glycerol-3-phosphate 3-phosphatidyltransferase
MMPGLRHLPLVLTLSRFVLGPALILLARTGPHPVLFLALLLAGLLSDVFDGILARRLGVATARLRVLDSRADLVFWLCTAAAAWVVHPGLVREHAWGISALVASEAATYLVSWLKFRRFFSAHAILSKLFALALFVALAAALCLGIAGVPYLLALVLGLAANAEVVAIILILPEWDHDIPSCWHALQIRRGGTIVRKKLFN